MFNKLMLLLPLALLTSAWKFWYRDERLAYGTGHNTNLRKNVLVEVRLHSTHLDAQDPLALGGQRRQDIALEAAQHEGLELLVQLLDLHFMIRIREIELVGQLD